MAAMTIMANDLQELNEELFCKKHVDSRLLEYVQTSPEIQERVAQSVAALNTWIATDHGYASKNERMLELASVDLHELTEKVFSQTIYYSEQTTFVSVVSQIAGFLGFSDKREGVTTMAEILAILCGSDLFDISKEHTGSQLMIKSNVILPQDIQDYIDRGLYLMPMVVEPKDLTNNYQSPYLTFNEPVILGKTDHHAGNVGLDVVNIQNRIALQLDVEFLKSTEELPTKAHETVEQVTLWNEFMRQSKDVYIRMIEQGNQFYIPNRLCKRLRLYAQGWHINPQGTPYKKAMIELHHEEVVQDVPIKHRIP